MIELGPPYNTEIPIRPISDYEIDCARRASYDVVKNKESRDLLFKIKTGLVSMDTELGDVDLKDVAEGLLEVDYWVVYFAIKDFSNPTVNIEDIKKMVGVKDIAREVYKLSGVIKESEEALEKFPERKKDNSG